MKIPIKKAGLIVFWASHRESVNVAPFIYAFPTVGTLPQKIKISSLKKPFQSRKRQIAGKIKENNSRPPAHTNIKLVAPLFFLII